MSFSKIEICNMALARSGSTQQIQALDFADDATVPVEARQCKLFFPLALEAVARSARWACLQKLAPLATLAATAAEGYAAVYALPADYLGWPEFDEASTAFRRIGRQLHTDRTVTTLIYVARTEDTDLFDPLFVEALVLRLAAYLATGPAGGEGVNLAQALNMWYERVCLPLALFVNSLEQGQMTLESDTWLSSRL
jgi:hypothetical protein